MDRPPRVYAADDSPNDCFRRYAKVEDSYQDHSEFLVSGVRYSPLFELSITDYKGWARGLQQMGGYATDRLMPTSLLNLLRIMNFIALMIKKISQRGGWQKRA